MSEFLLRVLSEIAKRQPVKARELSHTSPVSRLTEKGKEAIKGGEDAA